MAYKFRRKNKPAGWFPFAGMRFGFRLPRGSEEQDAKLNAPNYWKAIGAATRLFQKVAKAMDDQSLGVDEIQERMAELQAQLESGETLDDPDLAQYLKESEEIVIPGEELEEMAKFLRKLTVKVNGLEDEDDHPLSWKKDLNEDEQLILIDELGYEFIRDYHGAVLQSKGAARLGIELPTEGDTEEDEAGDEEE